MFSLSIKLQKNLDLMKQRDTYNVALKAVKIGF